MRNRIFLIFSQLCVQIGEIPGPACLLVLFVDEAAVDDAAEEHAHKSGDQCIEEEYAHVDVHGCCYGQRRSSRKHQSECTGGSYRDRTAVSRHGVAGLAGEDAKHGGEHDIDYVAEHRNAGDKAGYGYRVLGTLRPHQIQHPVYDIVDAAGFIHEHAQHDAQSGDDTDGTQSRTEIAGNAG